MRGWTIGLAFATIAVCTAGCPRSDPNDDTDQTDTDAADTDTLDTDAVDTDIADTDAVDTDLDACSAISGRTFASVEELECGLGPNGVALCHWHLTLSADGSWTWQHSDYGESGTWTCADGVVSGSGLSNYTGTYDLGTGTLSWDGHDYQ
jgi:hypothetical protein